MGEYLVHSVEGFTGLFDAATGAGKDGFATFLNSPSPLILLGAIFVVWLTRKRR